MRYIRWHYVDLNILWELRNCRFFGKTCTDSVCIQEECTADRLRTMQQVQPMKWTYNQLAVTN